MGWFLPSFAPRSAPRFSKTSTLSAAPLTPAAASLLFFSLLKSPSAWLPKAESFFYEGFRQKNKP
jgi:hypothetical protein